MWTGKGRRRACESPPASFLLVRACPHTGHGRGGPIRLHIPPGLVAKPCNSSRESSKHLGRLSYVGCPISPRGTPIPGGEIGQPGLIPSSVLRAYSGVVPAFNPGRLHGGKCLNLNLSCLPSRPGFVPTAHCLHLSPWVLLSIPPYLKPRSAPLPFSWSPSRGDPGRGQIQGVAYGQHPPQLSWCQLISGGGAQEVWGHQQGLSPSHGHWPKWATALRTLRETNRPSTNTKPLPARIGLASPSHSVSLGTAEGHRGVQVSMEHRTAWSLLAGGRHHREARGCGCVPCSCLDAHGPCSVAYVCPRA